MKHLFLIFLSYLSLLSGLLAEEFPSLARCEEVGCEKIIISTPINIDFNFNENDCYTCDSEIGKKTPESRLTEEIKELIKVGLLTEVLVDSQSEPDKKKHVRAGSYIGYFSSAACRNGPDLLQLNIRINKTGQFFCAMAGATVAGILKEVYDSTDTKNHTVDAKDIVATSLGAFSNITLYQIRF